MKKNAPEGISAPQKKSFIPKCIPTSHHLRTIFSRKVLELVLILIILCGLSMHVAADDGRAARRRLDSADDDAELSRLLSVIDKHTEIATKSKLNVDYVPGMVTVLEGRDLLNRGVRNVGEALGLVPGLSVNLNRYGPLSLSVRGLSESYGYASNMFMLNGIPVNNVLTGKHDLFWGIPIEQVERIEVIRGPGAALHGGYANTGVINVMTRSEGNAVYGEAGKYETFSAGGIFSWSNPEHDVSAGLNLAGMDTDGADNRSGPDKLYNIGQQEISNAPGSANEDRSTRSAFMNLDYKAFSLLAQYVTSGHGDYFGVDYALPPDSDGIAYENECWNVVLNQRVNMTSTLWLNMRLGYFSYTTSSADRVFMDPPGYTLPGHTYPYGMAVASRYTEDRYQGSVNMTWTGWERHRFFTECAVAHTYQGDDTFRAANYDIDTLEPDPDDAMQRYDDALVGKGRKRQISSVVVQDEYSVSRSVDITAGLRYDQYNDTDVNFSPRVAGVFRLSDAHIFKAQYAQAYTPPSFLQLYFQRGRQSRDTQLKPLTSQNFELGYIHRSKDRVARLTLFHTDLDDLIAFTDGMWSNSGGAKLSGVELELEQSLFSILRLDGNISYAYTEDKDSGEPVPETANFVANAGISYELFRDLVLNVQYRYVGEQVRVPQDPRGRLKASHTVDTTGSFLNLLTKGLTLRAGVKNILDEDVRCPAPMNTYPEDYPISTRRWWAEFSYEF